MLEHGKWRVRPFFHKPRHYGNSNVCLFVSTDSPFPNGHGNDYLFVGNMVYTVSILLLVSVVFFYFVFGMQIHFRTQHCTEMPLCAVIGLQSILLCLAIQSPLHSNLSFLYIVPVAPSHTLRYHFTPYSLLCFCGIYLLLCACGGAEYFTRHCKVYNITLMFIISTVASALIQFFFFYLLPFVCLCSMWW